MVCDEATPYRTMLEIKYPLEGGVVRDWDDMYLIWKYSFNKVKYK
jgi:actin-related protein 2